jgi:hypothetical protein
MRIVNDIGLSRGYRHLLPARYVLPHHIYARSFITLRNRYAMTTFPNLQLSTRLLIIFNCSLKPTVQLPYCIDLVEYISRRK